MSELRLTRQQRAAFFAGNWPRLAGKGAAPVKAGYTCQLSTRLSFEVIRVHHKRGRWRLEYQVTDDRDQRYWLLPGNVSLRTDERGALMPAPPEEDVGYTRNPKRARLDPLPAVPPDVHNVLRMRAKLSDIKYNEANRSRALAQQQSRQLARKLRRLQANAAKHGVDIAPTLARMIAEAEREIAGQRVA
jgi:hypothetical protein